MGRPLYIVSGEYEKLMQHIISVSAPLYYGSYDGSWDEGLQLKLIAQPQSSVFVDHRLLSYS